MGRKVKSITITCLFLLFGLGFGSIDVASANPGTALVQWDYYVVAGYNVTPSPPPVPPSPTGFQFAVDPPVYNFGNITKAPLKTWLYEGAEPTPYGSAYATAKITNLLGYGITITNLTVEVTAGTPVKPFYFPLADVWFGNFTLVHIDTLDPYDAANPFAIDECNYNTGEVIVLSDGDWWTKACGTPYPEMRTGPASLLEPDKNGDAAATDHVTPVSLANGATFTEYFGIIIFGDADAGTQIDGRVTLSLTYEWEPLPLPVGGKANPIIMSANNLELMAPYIGLATLLVVTAMTVVYVNKRKRNRS